MTKHNCTRKIEQYRMYMTDIALCEILGMSRPTFYTRLKESNWKVSEIYMIEKLKL